MELLVELHMTAAYDSGASAPTEDNPFSSMSRFYLDFSESKPKFLFPNSFSTIAEKTPTTSLVVEVVYKRRQRTRRSLVFSPNGRFTQACYVLRVNAR